MMEADPSGLSLPALRSGSRAEFARLVEAYSTPIYNLALRLVRNPQDAEDVLQATFLKAMQNLPRFEGRSSLSTWLYRIAVNEGLMLLRRRHPEIGLDLEAEQEQPGKESYPQQLADWCCLPEQELLSQEARRMLDRAVQALPETLRVVFLLRDVEGLSILETGQALDLSETAVKARLLRARLRLRAALSDYYAEQMKNRKEGRA